MPRTTEAIIHDVPISFGAILGAMALMAMAGAIFTSGAPVPQAPDSPKVSDDPRLVAVQVSVMDRDGRFVANLPQSAFRVTENGVEQPIGMFRTEDAPISLGLVIDGSASMRAKHAAVVGAAKALVSLSGPQDETFVVQFNDDVFLDQPLTKDLKKIEAALDKVAGGGGSAIRDAINMSMRYMKQQGRNEKKVLLVVTDGDDNQSEIELDQLVLSAQQTGVIVYSVGFLTEEEPREALRAKNALSALAQTSGGLDFYPTDLADLNRIMPIVNREIRSQYTLGYLPANGAPDAASRIIKVVVTGYTNVRMRTVSDAIAGARQ